MAIITAPHQDDSTCMEVATANIVPGPTIYKILRNFKRRGSFRPKKKSTKCLDHSKRGIRCGTSYWQCWACHKSEQEDAGSWFAITNDTANKPLLSNKNIKGWLLFFRKYWGYTAGDYEEVIFSDVLLVWRRKIELYHQFCITPAVKYPETIHVWGCFSSRRVGLITTVPNDVTMNKEWYQNIVQEQPLPTIKEKFGDGCFFQYDGVPCHVAQAETKWINEWNAHILGPWTGNSPGLNPAELMVSPNEGGRETKPKAVWSTSSTHMTIVVCH